jgi:hypothetical protein
MADGPIPRTTDNPIAYYKGIRGSWRRYYSFWYFLHYALGVLAILFSTLTAAALVQKDAGPLAQDFVAWLAALFTSLVTFLSAESRGNRYNRAWRLLSSAITKYELDQNSKTAEHVARVHEICEAIIHNESSDKNLSPPASPISPSPIPPSPGHG